MLTRDGRSLLRNPLPPDATSGELTRAALKDILELVVRDLVDLIPLLREFDLAGENLELPIGEMNEIRRMAFIRGHIPYVTNRTANVIGKALWRKAIKDPPTLPEVMSGNMPSMRVFTCDWVCSVLPAVVHGDIYANGREGGGRGFNRESIFELAADRDIIINSLPSHPLERSTAILPLAECITGPEEVKNDLPAPPEFPEATSRDFPLDKATLRDEREQNGYLMSDHAFTNMVNRIGMDARERIYRVGKMAMNRLEMMKYLPWAMTEGSTRRELCKGINGTPSMLEVAKWESMYPDFKENMRVAEQVQAHTFMDQAHEIVMGTIADKDQIALAKLQSNFLVKRAALQDEKFRDKQVIQTENLNQKNEAELKHKLKMLILGNMDAIGDIIDVTPQPVLGDGDEA